MSDNFFEPIKVVSPSQMEFANEQVDPTVRGDFIDYSRAKLQQGYDSGLTGKLVDFALTKYNESTHPELAQRKKGSYLKVLYPYGKFKDDEDYSISEAITNQNRAIVNDISATLSERQNKWGVTDLAASIASGVGTDALGFYTFGAIGKGVGAGLGALGKYAPIASKIEGTAIGRFFNPTTKASMFTQSMASNVGTNLAVIGASNSLLSKISEDESYNLTNLGIDAVFSFAHSHFAYRKYKAELNKLSGEPLTRDHANSVIESAAKQDIPITQDTSAHLIPETGPRAKGISSSEELRAALNDNINADGRIEKISGQMYVDLNSGETTAGPGILLSSKHMEGAQLVDFKNMNMVDGFHEIKPDNSIINRIIVAAEKEGGKVAEFAANLTEYMSETGDMSVNYHKFFTDMHDLLESEASNGASVESISRFEDIMRKAFIDSGIDGYKTNESAVLFNTSKAKTDITTARPFESGPVETIKSDPPAPINPEEVHKQNIAVQKKRVEAGESKLDPLTMKVVADYESTLLDTAPPDETLIDQPQTELKKVDDKIEGIKNSISESDKYNEQLKKQLEKIPDSAKQTIVIESEYYAKVQEKLREMEYSKREQETLMKAFTNCILRGM